MENKEIELFRAYLTTGQGQVPTVLSRLLEGLSDEDLTKLRSAALHGKLAIELEQQSMANRHLASQVEMREFVSAINQYESLSNPFPTLSGIRDQREIYGASGRTTVSYRRGCFVASFVYADPSHPDVILLRRFRRSTLEQLTAGRSFSAWYYRNGQKAAQIVRRLFLRRPVKFCLWCLCRFLSLCERSPFAR
jgi:hypothetical protein